MNRLTRLIALSFFLIHHISQAQKDTSGHVGYVVTSHRDTLKGLVYNHHKKAHAYIVLKHVNGSLQDSTLLPKDVITYVANNKSYRTVKMTRISDEDTTYQFAQVIVEGPISLYETKIKTDPILPPTRAFLAEKLSDHRVVPFGKVYYIVPLIEDNEQLKNDIIDQKYDNTLNSKKKVCEIYNDWVAKR